VLAVDPAGRAPADDLALERQRCRHGQRAQARREGIELGLVERASLDEHLGVAGDRVDRPATRDLADVRALTGELIGDPHQRVDRAGCPAIPPRVATGSGHRDPGPRAPDMLGRDLIQAMALDRDRRRGPQLLAGVQGPA
jgi:hypothetical protein